MKILFFILCFLIILKYGQCSISNCAYESNNNCLVCYFGFKIQDNKCENCNIGYTKFNGDCIETPIFNQIMGISIVNSLNSDSGVNSLNYIPSPLKMTIGSMNSPQAIVTNLVTGNQNTVINDNKLFNTDENKNNILSRNQPTISTPLSTGPPFLISPSVIQTSDQQSYSFPKFDINNATIIYFLDIFGLKSKIPINCFTFTSTFKCLECEKDYYLLSDKNICVVWSVYYTVMYMNNEGSEKTMSNRNTGTSTGVTGVSQSTSTNTASSSSSTSSLSSSTSSQSSTISTSSLFQIPNCNKVVQGICIECFYRFYFNQELKKCVQVNTYCNTWNNLGHCLTCYPGYKIQGIFCVVQGMTGNAGSSISGSGSSGSSISGPSSTSITQPTILSTKNPSSNMNSNNPPTTDYNCKNNVNGICQQCYYGYYVNQQTKLCNIVNSLCKTWNNQGHCTTCYQGYSLNGVLCVISIQGLKEGEGKYTGSVFIRGDSTSTNPIGRKNTISIQSQVNPLININTNTNSQSSSSSNPNTNKFENSDINCKQHNPQTGVCNICFFSYYFQPSVKKCVSVNPLCKTWNSFGHCLSCFDGYNLNQNLCKLSAQLQSTVTVTSNDLPQNPDPFCYKYQNKICVQCATRMYLDMNSKKCIQIDLNCKIWINETGMCKECYDGYTISNNQRECSLAIIVNGQQPSAKLFPSQTIQTNQLNYINLQPQIPSQIKNQLNTDQKCRSSDSNGICTQCIFRYVLNQSNKKCIQVSDLCKTWNQITGVCESCYAGYQLSNNGQCKQS